MADPVFTQSSEAPVVTTSSLDGDPELRANWEQTWADIDAEAEAKDGLPDAPEPPVEHISKKTIDEAEQREQEPIKVEAPQLKKRKLTDSTKAPSEREIAEVVDGPPEVKAEAKSESPITESKPGEPDIDSLEPHPASTPESKSHFKKLKEAAASFRESAKASEEKLSTLAKAVGVDPADFDGLINSVQAMRSQPQMPSIDAQELEALRVFSHASKLQDSISYLKSYKQPITAAKLAWIDRAAQFWNNSPEAIQKWANEAKQHHEEINSGWFQQQVQALVQHGKVDQLTYQGLLNEATNIVSKEDEGKRTLQEISKDPVTFNKWSQVENELKGREIGEQIGKAVANAFDTSHAFMKDWKQKAPDDAVFAEREKRFKATVEGAYSNPDQMARFALDNLFYKEEFPKVEKELQQAKSELAALRRRIGVTRKVADAPLKPQNGHSPSTTKMPTTDRIGAKPNFDRDLPR